MNLLMLFIGVLGFPCGLLLGFMALEEMEGARKYLTWLQHFLLAALVLVGSGSLFFVGKIIDAILVILLGFTLIMMGWRTLRWQVLAATAVLVGILFLVVSDALINAFLMSLFFLYGLVSGTMTVPIFFREPS